MIAFLTLLYVGLLAILVKLRVLPNSTGTWMSTIVWFVLLFLVLFVPMQWGAPSGEIRMFTRTVQIIPNVSGEVIEVDVLPNEPKKEGDLLFRLDPRPFEAAVAQAEATVSRVTAQVEQDQKRLASAQAQLRSAVSARELAQQRFNDDKRLVETGAIPANRLDTRIDNLQAATSAEESAQAAVAAAQLEVGAVVDDGTAARLAEAEAALDRARWDLEQTVVTAPGNGFVTYAALLPGQRVTSFPVQPSMVYVNTDRPTLAASINQIHLRYVKPGQAVEIAFKTLPGQILTGTVGSVVDIASQGQVVIGGTLPMAGGTLAEPFFVLIDLDETDAPIRPGTVGTVAIYTESVQVTHIIRKVMIRMESIMNYIVPGL